MASKEFLECLTDVYEGEMTGEVAFTDMLAAAENAEQRYVLGTRRGPQPWSAKPQLRDG